MSLGGTGLVGKDEAGTDPNGRGAQHESCSDRLSIEQTTGSNNLDGLTGQRALVALDQLGDGRNENSSGNITSVTTTLSTLGADNVGTDIEALLDVLGVTDHVHVENASLVQSLDDRLGGDSDGGDEELRTALNDDLNQLVELSLGVVIAIRKNAMLARCSTCAQCMDGAISYLVFRALPPTWGRRRSTPKGAFLSVR